MRIRDWSSDVCSSDLQQARIGSYHALQRGGITIEKFIKRSCFGYKSTGVLFGRGSKANTPDVVFLCLIDNRIELRLGFCSRGTKVVHHHHQVVKWVAKQLIGKSHPVSIGDGQIVDRRKIGR